jgi:hypothetical protein
MHQRLFEIVRSALPRLEAIEEAETSLKPNQSVWSRKEILGHLVDSAQHNHGRFVQLGLENGTEFPGDNQDAWVDLQRWHERPWLEIIHLWHSYNLHLAWVIAHLPTPSLEHEGIVFLSRKTVSLRWLIEHYIQHLEHHLQQIEDRNRWTA